MSDKTRKLVIIGDGEFAETAYEYFTGDSEYEVIAFAVEKTYRQKEKLFKLPVSDFEDITRLYPPETCDAFVAVTYTQMNHLRARLCKNCTQQGYTLATYKSSRAAVSANAVIGQNVFIFENASIQRNTVIGEGSVIWCGAAVCHGSTVGEFCWIAPCAAVCGNSKVGDFCFIGANASVKDDINIADNVFLGMGAAAVKDICCEKQIYAGCPAKPTGKSSFEYFNVKE